ncbi:MAG: hypothetical protein N4A71_06655 [Carboxylicivirga sp.]|jgi:hypothetical protein|nr:hypothetical protein [Carboxylicivirga sp.]
MIDFIKCEVLNPYIEKIINNQNLSFKNKIDRLTGELNERKSNAYFDGLYFTIIDDRKLFIQGSLPKFLNGNNKENLDRFSFKKALDKIEFLFGIEAKDLKLQNLEFGVCSNIGGINPAFFLANSVIDYKTTTKEIRTHGGKGYTVLFPLNNYVVKLYDKGKQCNSDLNLLRYEIRVKKMTHIKKLKIVTLQDINDDDKWESLQKLLLKTFDNILICTINEYFEMLTEDEKKMYRTYTNQQYWIKFKPIRAYKQGKELDDHRKVYYRKRNSFKSLIKKYEFDSVKKDILAFFEEDFRNMLKY